MTKDVPAVDTAVRILERLGQDWPTAVSPGHIVSELGVNRSTCYNILATLQRHSWVVKSGERAGWTLGPRFFGLAAVDHSRENVVVQEEINGLSRKLDLVVFAAKRDEHDGYIVVAKADYQSGVRVTVDVGDRFPFSAPALMQAAYAWEKPEKFEKALERNTLVKFTEFTITGERELAAAFADVRALGYSKSVGQFDLGQGAAASIVFDAHGRPTTLVCTLAFSTRINNDTVDDIGKTLADVAGNITARLGGRVPSAEDDPIVSPG